MSDEANVTLEQDKLAYRIAYDEPNATKKLSRHISKVIATRGNRPLVVVCVGTDRVTGDAYGPLIGTQLSKVRGIDVYGTIAEPVHAVNVTATVQHIYDTYDNPFIVAIDACLGKFDHVGHIVMESGMLRPGAGVGKDIAAFGDYVITGVVNVSGFMEFTVISNTRLNTVMGMADVTVNAIERAWKNEQRSRQYVGRRLRVAGGAM